MTLVAGRLRREGRLTFAIALLTAAAVGALFVLNLGARWAHAGNGVNIAGHYIPIDPAGYLYVTDLTQTTNGVTTAGSTVSVFKESSNDQVATLPVGRGPKGIDVQFGLDDDDPYGDPAEEHYIYVANSLDNTVSVIRDNGDPATDTVAWTVPVGSSPWGLAVDHHTTRVAVANNASDSISIIDGDENQRLGTVALGAGARPEFVTVDSSNHRAYVADAGNGKISVIDLNAARLVTTINIGGTPTNLAVDGHGHVFVISRNGTGNGTIKAITESTNTVLPVSANTGPVPFGIAVNPVNGQISVTNNGNHTMSQYTFNGATFSNTATLNLPPDPKGVAYTEDGQKAYIAEQAEGTITQVDGSGAHTASDHTPPVTTINGVTLARPGQALTGSSSDDASGVGSVQVGYTAAGAATPPATTSNAALACADNLNLSCSWSSPLPSVDGRYKAWVRGLDRNTDTAGPTVEAWRTLDNILVDGTAPASQITAPSSGSVLIPGSTQVSGVASDNLSGVSSVVVIFSPTLLGSPTTTTATLSCNASRQSCTWTTTVPATLTIGTYNVTSKATDAAGNIEAPGPGTQFHVGV